jgi:hypothetical protein
MEDGGGAFLQNINGLLLTTWSYNTKDGTLHSYRCENLTSVYTSLLIILQKMEASQPKFHFSLKELRE